MGHTRNALSGSTSLLSSVGHIHQETWGAEPVEVAANRQRRGQRPLSSSIEARRNNWQGASVEPAASVVDAINSRNAATKLSRCALPIAGLPHPSLPS